MKFLGKALPFAVSPALGVASLLKDKGGNNDKSAAPSSPSFVSTVGPGPLDPNAPNKMRLG